MPEPMNLAMSNKKKNLFSLLNIVVILIALSDYLFSAFYSIQNDEWKKLQLENACAETNVLLKELSKQYILYCVIGFLLAVFPVYYLLTKWLENFVNRYCCVSVYIRICPFYWNFTNNCIIESLSGH